MNTDKIEIPEFRKAIENQRHKEYITTVDYKCNICFKQVKSGRSHAHYSIKKVTRGELARKELVAKHQRELRQRKKWCKED